MYFRQPHISTCHCVVLDIEGRVKEDSWAVHARRRLDSWVVLKKVVKFPLGLILMCAFQCAVWRVYPWGSRWLGDGGKIREVLISAKMAIPVLIVRLQQACYLLSKCSSQCFSFTILKEMLPWSHNAKPGNWKPWNGLKLWNHIHVDDICCRFIMYTRSFLRPEFVIKDQVKILIFIGI